MLLALAALLAVPRRPVAQSRPSPSAASPSGTLTLTVTTNGEGRVGYAVARGQTPVIGESHLGFLFTDSRQMLRNMELKGKTDGEGRRRPGSSRGANGGRSATTINEVALTFQERDKLRRTMRVRFRLFDDAVAFRYELPEQANLKTANIVEELTQFRVLGQRPRLVGAGAREQPRGISLQRHADHRGRHRADPVHHPPRRRDPRRDPRSGAGRLFRA